MKLIKITALALLCCLPLSCKSGSGSLGSESAAMSRSERIFVDGEQSLSGQVIKATYNSKKISVEMLFQNNGDQMVHFPLDGITMMVGDVNVTAKGFLGASMEKDIDLMPSQAKPRKYGFHTVEFGAGAPGPGTYEVKVTGIMDASNNLVGKDLVIPFTIVE